MSAPARILALVMAGGEGSRLYPLTAERSKPSVPFGGRHRIVDFVLSNLVNSGILSIYLLVQYKSQSLIEHIRQAWVLAPMIPQHFVTVVPPQMQAGPEWFQGTADAVYQNLHLIDLHAPDLVVVFGADHVYRMDVRQMIEFHRATGADVTVAAIPVPLAASSSFGIIETDKEGRIVGFFEKPEAAAPMPGRATHAFASMGNYIFSTEVLVEALHHANANGESDFGRHVLPRLARTHRAYAYDFADNRVPGVTATEEAGYWRDVGTIEAYFDAHFDLMGRAPRFKLFNPQWPVFAIHDNAEAAQVFGGVLVDCELGAGSLIEGARLARTVVRREVVIEEDADLESCIVMDRTVVKRGAKLKRAIVDQYNVLREGETIGFDSDADRKRFHVSDTGIVVVGRGQLT